MMILTLYTPFMKFVKKKKVSCNMSAQNETIKNDYETFKQFVAEYPKYFELAKKYQKNPGELLNFFTSIGEEILSRSINEVFINVSPKIQEIIGDKKFHFSDDTINALDSLITFLKENNSKRIKFNA